MNNFNLDTFESAKKIINGLDQGNNQLKARVARLEIQLNQVLDSGEFYISALEFDPGIDGELLEISIRKTLSESPTQSLAVIQADAIEQAMPDRATVDNCNYSNAFRIGWNTCLKEFSVLVDNLRNSVKEETK